MIRSCEFVNHIPYYIQTVTFWIKYFMCVILGVQLIAETDLTTHSNFAGCQLHLLELDQIIPICTSISIKQTLTRLQYRAGFCLDAPPSQNFNIRCHSHFLITRRWPCVTHRHRSTWCQLVSQWDRERERMQPCNPFPDFLTCSLCLSFVSLSMHLTRVPLRSEPAMRKSFPIEAKQEGHLFALVLGQKSAPALCE